MVFTYLQLLGCNSKLRVKIGRESVVCSDAGTGCLRISEIYIGSSFMYNFCMLCLFLPSDLIFVCMQFAPLDCPNAIDSFIGYWKPSLVLLLESELWPNLIMSAAAKGVSGFLIIMEHNQITVHDHTYFPVPSVHPSLQFSILQKQNFYLDYSQFLHHAFMLQAVVTYLLLIAYLSADCSGSFKCTHIIEIIQPLVNAFRGPISCSDAL